MGCGNEQQEKVKNNNYNFIHTHTYKTFILFHLDWFHFTKWYIKICKSTAILLSSFFHSSNLSLNHLHTIIFVNFSANIVGLHYKKRNKMTSPASFSANERSYTDIQKRAPNLITPIQTYFTLCWGKRNSKLLDVWKEKIKISMDLYIWWEK